MILNGRSLPKVTVIRSHTWDWRRPFRWGETTSTNGSLRFVWRGPLVLSYLRVRLP